MKALILKGINQPMRIQDITFPNVQIDECLIDIQYAAINHRDIWIKKGMYANIQLPIILGSDLCGVYEDKEVVVNPAWFWGENEAHQSSIFEVLGMPHNGSFAEKIIVPSSYVYNKPVHLSTMEAAALPLVGLTAYRALFVRAQLVKVDKLLITGIGGGVALMALKMAISAGIDVYVTSGDDNKIKKAIEIGAKGGVNYMKDKWYKSLKAQNDNNGFDVILDGAGGTGFNHLLKLANFGARITIYGGTRGNYSEVSPQMIFWKQISILGSTMGSDKDFDEMLKFVSKNKVIPIVDEIFRLEEGNEAFDKIERGQQFGKIVLKIND